MQIQSKSNSEQDFADKVIILASAGVSLIHVRAPEVMRALSTLRERIVVDGYEYYEWDIVRGLRELRAASLGGESFVEGDNELSITNILSGIGKERAQRDKNPSNKDTKDRYYVLVNPQFYWNNNPQLHQLIMEFHSYLAWSDIRIIFITPDIATPPDLSHYFRTVELRTPSTEELESSLRKVSGYITSDTAISLEEEDYKEIAVIGAGLAQIEFELSASIAMVTANLHDDGDITREKVISGVSSSKVEVVKRNDLLQLLQPENMDNVGGMRALKDWVSSRKNCYDKEAVEFGIDPPKGIVLVGLPGNGKSLAAKAIAWELNVPLLRLDIGRMFNSLLGESEKQMRTALAMVEAMSPCCSENTLITLADKSTLPIGQLYDKVKNGETFTLQGVCPNTGALLELSLSTIIRRKGKPMLRITSESGNTIDVTKDHKLLINRDGERIWVEAQHILLGDNLVEV